MHRGFVVLHRKITEWEWYGDTNTFRLFVHLLLTANHKATKYQGRSIGRGELVVGRKKLSSILGLSEQSIRTSLDRLKNTGEITIKTTNKFSIVTVTNYGLYQDKDSKSTSKLTNQQPTTNQQLTTSKQCNNITIKEPPAKKLQAEKKLNPWAVWVDVNREFERPDPANIGPDLMAAKTIGKNALDRRDLECLYRQYLLDNDPFLAKQGHSLRLMPGRINKYINTIEQAPAEFGTHPDEDAIIMKIEQEASGK